MRVHPINLSNEYDTVEFLPLSDMHIGSPFFNDSMFKQYIDYIKSAPNRYCVLNGDMMDVVTKCSVGDIYRQKYSPREQIEVAERALSPIKDRIWGIITGNHEDRIDKEVGISTPEILAYKLDVPFFGHEILLKVRFGYNSARGRDNYYTIYLTHGASNGRTRGAKANAIERLKNIVICDCYCMGHTHGIISFPENVYIPQRHCDEVIKKTMWFVNSGSYQDREGYAIQKNFPPEELGCPIVELHGGKKNKKITVLLGRV